MSSTAEALVDMDRIIIIGTGVFGLSTADYVRKRYPDTQLSIISRPLRLAPSDDIAKVVRIDYTSPERMTEAMEAQRQWTSNDIFAKVYRSIGRIVVYKHNNLAIYREINTAREELSLLGRQASGSELMEEQFGTTMAPESPVYVLNSDDAIVDWELYIS
jgi:glycine/D-amino acid oxidase-like deaminating enzyme